MEAPEFTLSEVEGTYTGTFWREKGSSEVSLELKNGKFTGGSNQNHFPAICSGSYTVKGNIITFSNECFFTADFDWSLILSDDFELLKTDEGLNLKSMKNSDQYKLVRTQAKE
ncbi:MAG TPA: hypothetical protein DCQ31_13055 [Bacteroidales bacterium]|nr:hypothetical protein [Bacteroidales bacterium]